MTYHLYFQKSPRLYHLLPGHQPSTSLSAPSPGPLPRSACVHFGPAAVAFPWNTPHILSRLLQIIQWVLSALRIQLKHCQTTYKLPHGLAPAISLTSSHSTLLFHYTSATWQRMSLATLTKVRTLPAPPPNPSLSHYPALLPAGTCHCLKFLFIHLFTFFSVCLPH